LHYQELTIANNTRFILGKKISAAILCLTMIFFRNVAMAQKPVLKGKDNQEIKGLIDENVSAYEWPSAWREPYLCHASVRRRRYSRGCLVQSHATLGPCAASVRYLAQ
jgi:hypothetical protein